MRDLRVSAQLELPVDVAGEAIGILAKRGAGKTNTAVVLVEELHRAGVQVVVLDPVGVWWGVRAGRDGSRKGGLPVPVLGGEHGDVPLEPAAGELVADVVIDSGQPVVVDVSEFSKTQQRSLVDAYERGEGPISKQECGRRAGYTVGDRVGGTFGNILGRLRTLGLIDYPAPGEVVALEVLFP